jgi:hypothetical protein
MNGDYLVSSIASSGIVLLDELVYLAKFSSSLCRHSVNKDVLKLGVYYKTD